MQVRVKCLSLGIASMLIFGCASSASEPTPPSEISPAMQSQSAANEIGVKTSEELDEPIREHDYRTFHARGKIEYGNIGDSYTADLVLYLASSQYMVVQELVQDFLQKNTHIQTAYVETMPPGQILKNQLLKQGQINGRDTAMNPDIFSSVNLAHLKKLKEKKLMSEYMVYIHNKLELMVAKGNPKNIKGAADLGRDDLVQTHPNPVTEGIMKFYGLEMLKDLKLLDKVTQGKECKECWAVPGKVWFTQHHRDTPDRIELGQADVGIVWTTEVLEAISAKRNIEGVPIAAPLNKADKVKYVIGIMQTARNPANAKKFLEYLKTDTAQNFFAKYGFVKATEKDLQLKEIPVE